MRGNILIQRLNIAREYGVLERAKLRTTVEGQTAVTVYITCVVLTTKTVDSMRV